MRLCVCVCLLYCVPAAAAAAAAAAVRPTQFQLFEKCIRLGFISSSSLLLSFIPGGCGAAPFVCFCSCGTTPSVKCLA